MIKHGFQGREDDMLPEFTPEIIKMVNDRHLELYEKVTGKQLEKVNYSNLEKNIFTAVETYLEKL